MTLETQDLSYSYGAKKALNSVTLSGIEAGKVTALIGPNAAGKSTLFKAIAGMVKTRTGSIRLDGAELNEMSHRSRLRQVCYMPQVFAANASLSVFDEVLLARKNLTGSKVRDADIDAVSGLLAELGIAHLGKTYVSDLSGGQQQLVWIAQALAREPRVLVFNQPTSALDLHRQLEIMPIIRQAVASRGIICMVAMLNINLATRFADYLVLMRDGRIASGADPVKVLAAKPAAPQPRRVKLELDEDNQGRAHVSAHH